jgi:hypothetical protein
MRHFELHPLRSDLEFIYQYQVNTTYTTLGGTVDVYHLAVQATLDSLTARVHEIKECCDNQQKGGSCGACVTTPDQTAQFFRNRGYIAIPIKILTPVVAKGDSLGTKPSAPGVDVCSSINSIVIDGDTCTDFATVVSHIVAEWPGGPGQAVITDNDCMCYGGLEPVFLSKHGPASLRLKLHISRDPLDPTVGVLYSAIVIPEALGVLPIKAFLSDNDNLLPHLNNFEDTNVKLASIANRVKDIYAENNISFQEVNLYQPTTFSAYSVWNKVIYSHAKGGGFSQSSNFIPGSDNQVNIDPYITNREKIESTRQVENILAIHFAHEFLHQILKISTDEYLFYGISYPWENWRFSNGAHVNKIKNLLFAGDALGNGETGWLALSEDEKKLVDNEFTGGWSRLFFGLIENPKASVNTKMEFRKISADCKRFIAGFLLLRSLENKNAQPCDLKCATKILSEHIKLPWSPTGQ